MTALDTDRAPNEPTSEIAVLAACLRSPAAMRTAAEALADDDFYATQHREVWGVLADFHQQGVTPDPGAVLIEATKVRPQLAGIVTNLVTTSLGWGDLGYHLQRIEAAAIRRNLQGALQRSWQAATESDDDPVAIAEDSIERLRLTQRMRANTHTEIDVLDFIAGDDEPEDWVIPNYLARGERLILTAPEGWGKTSAMRQIAARAAAGSALFQTTGDYYEPIKVLVIDAENPKSINRVEYRSLMSGLNEMGAMPKPGMLFLEPCGPTNVLDPREAARLMAVAERVKPDLITIGPIYQLHEENPSDEGPARKVSAFLDRLRNVNQSALVIEAHTPHSDGPHGQLMRPFGASLWKRWPEFGLCLHGAVDTKGMSDEQQREAEYMRESLLTPWRGARGRSRQWPRKLVAGTRLPWVAVA